MRSTKTPADRATVATMASMSIASATMAATRLTTDSRASERRPTDPVSRNAADFIAIVTTAAAIDSHAKIWSGDSYVTELTVDTVVSRLRRKIERDPQDPELILTAWGVGYKFVDAE